MHNKSTQKRKAGIARLIEIAGGKKWWLFASMSLAVLATIAQFIPVIVIYKIIIELANHATDLSSLNQELLWDLGFVSLWSLGVFGILLYASSMLSHIAAYNILYEIRVRLAEKLTHLSMGFFTQKASGEIKKVMSEDVEEVELFIAHHIPDITSAVVFPIIVIVFMFFTDWRLTIAALIPFPITLGIMGKMMMSEESMRGYREYHNALEKMSSAVVEYVRGMPVVKVFGTSMDAFCRLSDSIISYRDWSQKISDDYSRVYPSTLTMASSSLVFIVPVSILILYKASFPVEFIPVVLFFTVIGAGFFFPLLKLLFMSGFLNRITVGVERIDEILYRDCVQEKDNEVKPADMSIVFDHVCFSYESTPILEDVSFLAKPDTVTALVGPSGAGKTTMGLLAARFWDIQSGAIRIGDNDIRDMKLESLMNLVSFVFQDGFLFFDTIEENIRMGNTQATYEEVIAAAKAAQCHEFIERLPAGYQTLVGEGGVYLSGGEQQRISIARAILKNTPIVILDEATAFADPENEGRILEGLAHLIKNKTVIIIAHRLSTIIDADQILVIDKGKVIEEGQHSHLVENGGLYSKMWETYSKAREWTLSSKGAKSL
jgi:ATP-binding cassette subfamily B protein IrtA